MCFTIFQSEKTHFQPIKRKSSKSRKIDIFPKGLTHGFGLKRAIFPSLFFYGIQARKISFTIFQSKKTPFSAIKKQKSKKSKNGHFSKGFDPCFWSKNGHFLNLFFLENIGQETVFYDILKWKKAFLGYKNKMFERSKNCHFSKGFFSHG